MAFKVLPAHSGKHRRTHPVRTAATLAGVAVLATGGAIGATAMASPGAAPEAAAQPAAFTRALNAHTAALVRTLTTQEQGQYKAADTAKAKAAATARVRQALASARAEAKAKAATKAKAAAKAGAAARAEAAAAAKAPTARAAQQPAASRSQTRTALPAASASGTGGGTAGSTATGWMEPVGDASVGTGYQASGSLWSSGSHTGVDFLVDSGTPVHAVAVGTVVSAGADGAYGNDVIIKHADGKYTLYGHLTEPLVSAGQTVTEGQEIGISGATGNVTGPHLHFEVRTTPDYGSDIDPVAYLASHGVVI
ncbi:M23 family metallopeptidase [Actinacidiphila sp. ITFR-21]|uniref:M23 family metallopeptidase n=1 Tax=Actinacidiphila sp. ITFR-21 TaxID=3075199 RepID=UPI00288B9C66|nr:M23 family metallopeptidase [Streptomyces sp. ITFR-21]WNI18420.1 M23 family metallopeptidase [Streptomyces sp. ITFR-21]